MITIENHRALGAQWLPSPNIGGRMEPQLIVLHETAGHLTPGNAAAWLCNPSSKVSAHFVVERDGSIVQLVACDRVAWHAGKSSFQGRDNCNGFSIGVEIVGPGKLTLRGNRCYSWFGESWPVEECELIESAAHGGTGWWLPFTDAQIAAVEQLADALLAAYGRVTDLAGHYEVSPGRKVDPAPTFPIDQMKALCWDRAAPDKAVVAAAQTRLLELGYDVGDVDGLAGPKLRGRVRDFQEQAGIAITGELDEATMQRLARDDAPEMTTGTRSETTKAAAQPAGSWWAKRGTEVQAGQTVFDAFDKSGDAVGKFAKAKSVGEQGSVLLNWASSPIGVRTILTLATCGLIWFAINKVDWAAVRARIKGLSLGRA